MSRTTNTCHKQGWSIIYFIYEHTGKSDKYPLIYIKALNYFSCDKNRTENNKINFDISFTKSYVFIIDHTKN